MIKTPGGYLSRNGLLMDRVNCQNIILAHKRLYIEKRLTEKLSRKYIVGHSLVIISIATCLMIIQIYLIALNTSTNISCSSGSGIWVGVFLLISAATTLFLTKYKCYNLMVASFMFTFCSIFVSAFGSIFLNALTLRDKSSNLDDNYLNLIITMIFLGVLASSVCTLYVFIIQCVVIGNWKRRVFNDPRLQTSDLSTNVNNTSGSANHCHHFVYANFNQTPNIWYVNRSLTNYDYDLPPSYEVTMKTNATTAGIATNNNANLNITDNNNNNNNINNINVSNVSSLTSFNYNQNNHRQA